MRKSLITLSLLTLLTGTKVSAQTTALSPYSRYGIGDISPFTNAAQVGMGGLSTGFASNNFTNLSNPAANVFLDKPIFDFAVKSQQVTISTDADSRKLKTTYINHFAYAFPVKNKFCLSVGLVPYSRIGYTTTSTEALNDSATVTYKYKGSGGINKAFIGSAYKLLNRKDSTVLSIGFNLNYVFGTMHKEARTYFPSDQNYNDSKEVLYTSVRDVSFDLGSYFSFYPNPSKSLKVNFGATLGIGTKLRSSQEQLLETFFTSYGGAEYAIDTIVYQKTEGGSIKLPTAISLGSSIVYKDKWVLGIDYRTQNWSSFTQNLSSNVILDNITNSSQILLGVQFTPRPNAAPKSNFFTLINYRAGYRMEKTYVVVKGEQISGNAFSVGLGIPLKRSNSLSRINISYESFTRGTTANSLLKEQYSNFVIGVSIAPSNIDRWFYKRKYD